jgi:hypothetical protein
MKTVKISEETHTRILKVMGTLQANEGKRKTVEDALAFLLHEHDKNRDYKAEDAQKH